MKKKKSRPGAVPDNQVKLSLYFPKEHEAELREVCEREHPGLTVQKASVQLLLGHIRDFKMCEKNGTLVEDRYGRASLPPFPGAE